MADDTNNKPDIKKEKDLNTIYEFIRSLTCETRGVGDLLRSEFANTCTPTSVLGMAYSFIVSPIQYAPAMARLKINDDNLFASIGLGKHQCGRTNRIKFNDQKISFAVCNDKKLAKLISSKLPAIAKDIALGSIGDGDILENILKDIKLDPKDFHDIHRDVKVGSIIPGIFPVSNWKIEKRADKICVSVQSFGGWTPVGCKFIEDPYPNSIYNKCFTKDGDSSKCSNMTNCVYRATSSSQIPLPLSSIVVYCVESMLAKVVLSDDFNVNGFNDIDNFVDKNINRKKSALYSFQDNMHNMVTLILIIYVIIQGSIFLLKPESVSQKQLLVTVFTIIIVSYFSVGININFSRTSENTQIYDGISRYLLPLLFDSMNFLSDLLMNSLPGKLCYFDPKSYKDGMQNIALWDSLDCKLFHYLGLDEINTFVISKNGSQGFDNTGFSIPLYFYLLVPAILSGYFSLVPFIIAYPILLFTVGAFLVTATITSMICIVILSVLAPIFVSFYLFDYTKPYFQAWLRMLISFVLQPMIIVLFITVILAVYNLGFYGTCKYTMKEFSVSSFKPASKEKSPEDKRKVKVFFIDNNFSLDNYNSKKDIDKCKTSIGYLFDSITNVDSWKEDAVDIYSKVKDSFNEAKGENSMPVYVTNNNSSMKAIKVKQGDFFSMVIADFNTLKEVVMSIITACVLIYLMSKISDVLAEFAADMSKGIVLNKNNFNSDFYGGGNKSNSPKQDQSGDSMSSKGSRSGDSMSSKGSSSGDSMSSKGSSSGDSMSSKGSSSGDSMSSKGSSSGDSASSKGSSSGDSMSSKGSRSGDSASSKGSSSGDSANSKGSSSSSNVSADKDSSGSGSSKDKV
ncbi:MAG TPA: type IV secretion system protein [Candidatus Megaira endosymbiont of Hartmannula sinica]|nr:type IV secretion system protein [Candidatus Megaera endosymbiont of Hartmannula sinica]